MSTDTRTYTVESHTVNVALASCIFGSWLVLIMGSVFHWYIGITLFHDVGVTLTVSFIALAYIHDHISEVEG